MRDAANEFDARRSMDAVASVVSSVEKRLSATVRDNAVWDDAYAAVSSPKRLDWIWENWGSTSVDYPLYDGIVVLSPKATPVAAYLKGKEVDAAALLGKGFISQSLAASKTANSQARFNFYRLDGKIAVAATMAIRPFSKVDLGTGYYTLTFFKVVDRAYVDSIAQEFQIESLAIQPSPDPKGFSRVIADVDVSPLAISFGHGSTRGPPSTIRPFPS